MITYKDLIKLKIKIILYIFYNAYILVKINLY